MIVKDFYEYDTKSNGTKGLVYIGDRVIVYRRDNKTNLFPLHLDLPGGGPENKETPFETFRREVMEEFSLNIARENIKYAVRSPSSLYPDKYAYFCVAKLPKSYEEKIVFGDEGIEYMLMDINEFIEHKDGWPIFQLRAKDYLKSMNND